MKKILLVDNVQSILDREKGFLNRDTFQVSMATSGDEAIELHGREKFDVIIMDIHMPGMSGEQACKAIRENGAAKNVAILLATLSDDPVTVDRIKKAGANGYIKKPIRKDDLDAKLANILNVPTRQSIRILIRVKVEGILGGEFFMANTVDVSETGLLFECDRGIKQGDTVETSFFLPSPEGFKHVVVKSEVMRVAEGGGGKGQRCGSRFVEFKEGSRELIAKFVAEKTAKGL